MYTSSKKGGLAGGACDGWKFENVGYVMRGGREMDNHFEVMGTCSVPFRP